MSTTSSNRRSRIVLYSVIAAGFLGILAMYLVLVYARTPQARSRQNQALPIVGTWVGEEGNVLNIRSDGTARSRSNRNSRDVSYFEWTADSREFRIFLYAKKHSLSWFVRRALLDDTPSDRYEIITLTPTEFTIRSQEGHVTTFAKARDDELQSAP